jgi:hypothetical protein
MKVSYNLLKYQYDILGGFCFFFKWLIDVTAVMGEKTYVKKSHP